MSSRSAKMCQFMGVSMEAMRHMPVGAVKWGPSTKPRPRGIKRANRTGSIVRLGVPFRPV